MERYRGEPQYCGVGWPVPFLGSGSTLLERYHPELRHFEGAWPVPFLAVIHSENYAMYPITVGGAARGRKERCARMH